MKQSKNSLQVFFVFKLHRPSCWLRICFSRFQSHNTQPTRSRDTLNHCLTPGDRTPGSDFLVIFPTHNAPLFLRERCRVRVDGFGRKNLKSSGRKKPIIQINKPCESWGGQISSKERREEYCWGAWGKNRRPGILYPKHDRIETAGQKLCRTVCVWQSEKRKKKPK